MDASSRLITPGFVDAHCHGESFVLRFITAGHASSVWPALVPLRRALETLLDPAMARQVTELYSTAGIAHLSAGTTCVGEYLLPFGGDGMTAALDGLGRSGIRHAAVLQTWEQIGALQARLPGDVRCAVSLGTEDQFTVYSLENLLRAARELQCPVAAHVGEHRRDVEAVRRNFRKPPLTVLREFGALTAATQLMHCNHLGAADLAAVREISGTIALCASAAAAKRTGYPLLMRLASHDVRLCLGTDWGSPGILQEMKFLRRLPQFVPGIRSFSPLELLRMATINGAHALGWSEQTGSLEIGKKADCVMFSLDDMRLPALGGRSSTEELAAALVDYMEPGAVTDVMVDGTFRIRNGQPAFIDVHEVRRSVRSLQEKFLAGSDRTGTPEKSAPLFPSGEERYIRGGHDAAPPSLAEPDRQANLLPPAPPPQEEPRVKLPELSRTVKKVFGEDEL